MRQGDCHNGRKGDHAFYDEPCFRPSNANYGVQGARTWTADFNEYFASMYGDSINPILYYPALFYDIGEKTAEARDALNRVRTEMFAKNYIGQMNEWCASHGLELLGHMSCEDVESPLAYHGDLMYCFKYQSASSVDVIYNYGMTEDYYKVVSSSAYNWDKPLVGVEAYGTMEKAASQYDVKIKSVTTRNGHLTCIHKVVDKRNLWFFANSSDLKISTTVTLRGEYTSLELWDPMTGDRTALATTVKDGVTTFTLSLDKALGETAFPWGIFVAAGTVAAVLTFIYAYHLVKKREVRKN